MHRVLLAATVGFLVFLNGSSAPADDQATSKKADAKKPESKDFFDTTKVWKLHLEITAKDHKTMEPLGGSRFSGMFGGGQARPEKRDDNPTDVHKGGGFGLEFPWVHGELTEGGTAYKNLGVRYKGNASYLTSARGLKRNFKVEFDHFGEKGRFHGLEEINLNAGAMDPTRGREALAYAVFRAAGVPAPRTTFAEVTLTVPGKYEKELLGLYTVIEQMDKTFLKDRFKNGNGLLMKPENVRSMDYLGDDWEQYKARYKPKREPSKQEAQRVIEFAKLVNKASDEQFRKEVGTYLDVDQFLRFTAANALVAHLDSFSHFEFGHNYYIYLNPETNKFVFIPWDLDLSLAGFPMGASPDQQLDLSVTQPYAGEHKLIERLLAMKEVNAKYQQILKDLAATSFSRERLLKEVEAIEKATKEVLDRETKAAAARKEGGGGFGPRGGRMGQSPDLRTFVEKRTESVAAQLSGKRKGYVLAKAVNPFGGGRPGAGPGGNPGGQPGGFPGGQPGGFPGGQPGGQPGGFPGGQPGGFPGGGGMQMPRPGEILPSFVQDSLKLTNDQKKKIAELQKEIDAKVEKILTDDQKAQLKKLREAGPGGRPGGFPGGFPGGQPGGFPGGQPGGFPGGRPGGAEPAVDPAEAKRVLDKAVQSHGGAEKLTKLTGATWKAKGSFTGPMGAAEFTEDIAIQFPGKSRFDVNVGNQFKFVSVLDGDKGWAKFGDQAREMDTNTIKELKENLYADWLTTLVPLSDKAFTLSRVGEIKVNDRAAVGFKVVRKDHRDVTLYFDKESGLLVKRATTAKDLFQGGVEFNEELIYSDYKEVNGVKRPTKIKQLKDGKEAMESTLSDIKLADKLDDKLFTRPE